MGNCCGSDRKNNKFDHESPLLNNNKINELSVETENINSKKQRGIKNLNVTFIESIKNNAMDNKDNGKEKKISGAENKENDNKENNSLTNENVNTKITNSINNENNENKENNDNINKEIINDNNNNNDENNNNEINDIILKEKNVTFIENKENLTNSKRISKMPNKNEAVNMKDYFSNDSIEKCSPMLKKNDDAKNNKKSFTKRSSFVIENSKETKNNEDPTITTQIEDFFVDKTRRISKFIMEDINPFSKNEDEKSASSSDEEKEEEEKNLVDENKIAEIRRKSSVFRYHFSYDIPQEIYDTSYRKTWDTSIVDYKEIKVPETPACTVYYYMANKIPIPFVSDRDFIEKRTTVVCKELEETVALYSAVDDKIYPKVKGKERGKTILGVNFIKMSGDSQIELWLMCQIDGKSSISPAMLSKTLPSSYESWYKNVTKVIKEFVKKKYGK